MKMWKKAAAEAIGDLKKYLETYGRFPFSAYPFNEVDSLLLCQLSYLRYDGLVPGIRVNEDSVSLGELGSDPRKERMFRKILFEAENRALFEALVVSRRFQTLKLNCYVNCVDRERETQFAAVTYLLESGIVYVAFRGTDESFVGWKEDFNMAFLYPVPGQIYAAKYLNIVAGKFSGAFYVGGHSKGGNFAIYGAMNCAGQVRNRIMRIYNMDGPGFRPEILRSARYERMAERVERYLPYSSVIGMLFATDGRYRVVQAKGSGLIQHNPSHWRVCNGHFVTAEHISDKIRRIDDRLNTWILATDSEQCRLLVDALYRIVLATQTKDLPTFAADWRRNMTKILFAIRETDEETKRFLRQNLHGLFGAWRNRDRTRAPGKVVLSGSSRSGCH